MLGKHMLIDYFDCDPTVINDSGFLEEFLPQLITLCGGTVLKSTFHQFFPQGVTGVVLIAESHCAIHTWPEKNQACVDLFSCGTKLDTGRFAEQLKIALKSEKMNTKIIDRGTN